MPEQKRLNQICPFLGLTGDPESRFSYPELTHRCFAADQESSISLEHQAAFCLGQNYESCARFVEVPAELTSGAITLRPESTKRSGSTPSLPWQTILWGLTGLLVGLLVILGILYYSGLVFDQGSTRAEVERVELEPTVTLVSTPTPVKEVASAKPTPVSGVFLATPTPTLTPVPGVDNYTLSPGSGDVGWVTSADERNNHFGDSFLYAGVINGQTYHGIFQIDLSSIPRGAPIYKASIQLTGLRDDELGVRTDQPAAAGAWMLRLLAPEIDQDWHRHGFQEIFNAPVLETLMPFLEDSDLAVGKTNGFELSTDQIRILEQRIVKDQDPLVSFRIDGPMVGPNNLFAWDTGYGPRSQGNQIKLILDVGPPPATPPPFDYVVVTDTPTPENIVTAAAIALQATADATTVGTATPLPPNLATATPIPEYLVLVPTSTPENEATAQFLADVATAETLLTGTPTPIPTNAVTATARPTETPTPTPVPIKLIVITNTPTAESVFAAATQSAAATAQALRVGTPTPLPANWVTPVVVTSTPTPENEATALAMAELAAVMAFTTGTPTSTPANIVTATPTPVFESISLIYTPTPVVPSPSLQSLPPVLLGKILFLSDREEPGTENVYMYDPETGQLGRLTDRWPYDEAMARETWSADERFHVFTKDAIRYASVGTGGNERDVRNDAPALYVYDYLYKVEQQITTFATGIAYGGVWSPTEPRIAFVSNDTADDEIWTVKYDGTELKRLTDTNEAFNAAEIGKDTFLPELSKYPTWSPDGQQIVFMSNRTKNQQLWIMNADGSDQHLLMGWDNWTPYNDWAPVWVKFLEPASQHE